MNSRSNKETPVKRMLKTFLQLVIILAFLEGIYYRSIPNKTTRYGEKLIEYWDYPFFILIGIMLIGIFFSKSKYNLPEDIYLRKKH